MDHNDPASFEAQLFEGFKGTARDLRIASAVLVVVAVVVAGLIVVVGWGFHELWLRFF